MAKQLYQDGDVIQAGANALEVTAVSYTEDPETQEKSGFTYSVRLKSELDAERAAEAARLKALEDEAAEPAEGTE